MNFIDVETCMKIGVLGFAHGHVNMYCAQWKQQAAMDIELAAGWDHDSRRLVQAVEEHGLEACSSPEALCQRADIDAVVISAETSLHADLVEQAAAAGKAIILQKPMALTLEDADRIVAAVETAQVPFTMAWQMRVDPENLQIRQLIDSGTLGRIYQVRRRHCLGVLLNEGFESSWHVDPNYNRDIFADDAAHAIDLLYWLFGSPLTVTARMTTAHKASMPNDVGVVVFEYAGGMLAEVSSSFACVAGENTTEIVGEKGVLVQNYGDGPSSDKRFDPQAPSLKWYLRQTGEWAVSQAEAPQSQGERIAGLAGPLADFLHGLRPPLATAEEGRQVLRLVLACYQANETGQRVDFV
ncbi:MAG: gfo/Idh/MocA family oxidoreductase [Candidatus Latescibacteria bacterium]|nr:gfo/Idh/MocA family oxidoreductase [Candidatus Latescibacterota bacterium]